MQDAWEGPQAQDRRAGATTAPLLLCTPFSTTQQQLKGRLGHVPERESLHQPGFGEMASVFKHSTFKHSNIQHVHTAFTSMHANALPAALPGGEAPHLDRRKVVVPRHLHERHLAGRGEGVEDEELQLDALGEVRTVQAGGVTLTLTRSMGLSRGITETHTLPLDGAIKAGGSLR